MSRLLFAVSFLILAAGGYLAWSTVQTTKLQDVSATANVAFMQQDWPKAARDYAAITRLKPKDADATFKLAYSRHMAGQYEDSLMGFWQALKLGYNESLCLYDVACSEARLGRKADALEHLAQAVEKGFKSSTFMEQDDDLGSLRGEAAYKALLAKLKDVEKTKMDKESKTKATIELQKGRIPAGTAEVKK